MAAYQFDESVLKKALSRLSYWKQLVFVLLICERLYPNYRKFSQDTGKGDEFVMRAAIDEAWNHVATAENETTDWRDLAVTCEEAAWDTEQSDSLYVSAALDAASVVTLAMQFIASRELRCVVEAAGLARDSVDLIVQELEKLNPQDPELEDKIRTHRLMQRELSRQHEDIDFLHNAHEDTRERLASSIRRWIEYGGGSLDMM